MIIVTFAFIKFSLVQYDFFFSFQPGPPPQGAMYYPPQKPQMVSCLLHFDLSILEHFFRSQLIWISRLDKS